MSMAKTGPPMTGNRFPRSHAGTAIPMQNSKPDQCSFIKFIVIFHLSAKGTEGL